MQPIDPKLESDLAKWRCQSSGPFFTLAEPPEDLIAQAVRPEFASALKKYGGNEGFLGREYLRLHRYAELIALNAAYGVPDLAPRVFIFGSDGGA